MAGYVLTVTTTSVQSASEGEATPLDTQDGRVRVIWSTDEVGRGMQLTIRPLSATRQTVFHSVKATVILSGAGDDDN
jgi:hypothetical protein